jgi:hypothetical protein
LFAHRWWHRFCSRSSAARRGITKEDHHSMKVRSTAVLALATHTQFGGSAPLARLGLAALIAFTPVTAALAQGTQGSGSDRAQAQNQRQAKPGRLTVPVTGTVSAAAGQATASEVTGTFSIQRFARTETAVAAVGTLTVSITDSASSDTRAVVTQVAVPISRQRSENAAAEPVGQTPAIVPTATQTCETLSLVLGPVDLDLRGVPVQLDRVVLDVTGAPTTSDALPKLLCEITGVLDNSAQPAELVTLLNRLLDLLG